MDYTAHRLTDLHLHVLLAILFKWRLSLIIHYFLSSFTDLILRSQVTVSHFNRTAFVTFTFLIKNNRVTSSSYNAGATTPIIEMRLPWSLEGE